VGQRPGTSAAAHHCSIIASSGNSGAVTVGRGLVAVSTNRVDPRVGRVLAHDGGEHVEPTLDRRLASEQRQQRSIVGCSRDHFCDREAKGRCHGIKADAGVFGGGPASRRFRCRGDGRYALQVGWKLEDQALAPAQQARGRELGAGEEITQAAFR
jgi:hypothetical protein